MHVLPNFLGRLHMAAFLVAFASRLGAASRNFAKRVNWSKLAGVLAALVPLVLIGAQAAAASGPPSVQYTSPSGGATNSIAVAVEGLATTIRWILGPTALLALVIAAFMNHVPNQRSKEQAKEVAMAAIVGLLIAAFAPAIINWITGIQV